MKEAKIVKVHNDYDYLRSEWIPIKSIKGEKHKVVWVDSFSFFKFYFSIIVFFSLKMEVAGDLHDLPPGPLA